MTNTPPAPSRNLILLDIENLTGSASPTSADTDAAIAALRRAVPSYDGDQRVVACSHHAARTVAFCFPGDRQIWRSGPDGADQALLEVLAGERVAERFGRVTICSGDGIFAEPAAWLARSGVEVTVVAMAGHLAGRLELAARHVTLLPSPAVALAVGTHPRW